MPVSSLIKELKERGDIGRYIVYDKTIPPQKADMAELPELHPALTAKLKSLNFSKLYSHQTKAIRAALKGENVIVATPTASGKTLCYTAPVIHALLKNPGSTALFLFPLKALARDQFASFTRMCDGLPADVRAYVFDGDTKPYDRKKVLAASPNVIFTNPDMLHLSILPYHGKWERFFKQLKYVVIDEAHTYRGVFGSHIAQVIRRLLRIARHYGQDPVLISCSATIKNPDQFARALTGEKFTLVNKSGAPRPGGHFIFYNTEGSPYTDSSKLMRAAVNEGLKTIVFTKARKVTELIYTWTIQAEPELAGRIGNYRAGFLPQERRKIESDLFSGKLDGVVSTSALEMGVDIGGLDVCILAGYPGAIINTWQRSGRVGRGEREFLIILVALRDALDQHFIRNPEDFFTRDFEAAVIDPNNETILKAHLVCAAVELPIPDNDPFLNPEKHKKVFAEMERDNILLRSADSAKWLSRRRYPHREVSIRSIGESYTIFGEDGKTVIGAISGSRVYSEGHEGAVYLHAGRQYIVTMLDMEKKAIHVKPMKEKYYTRARTDKETDILSTMAEKSVNGFTVKLGKLKVTEQVKGYEKRSIFGQDTLGVVDLDMPKTQFNTVGFWIELGDEIKKEIERREMMFMGGIHAFEHVSIALFPLIALCDRNDIGGIAYPLHPALGKGAIFFYDGYPDGVGLCESVFHKAPDLWEAALELLNECECDQGCPSCIHSPKCGSGNKPLDKMAATRLLMMVCGKTEKPKGGPEPVSVDDALVAPATAQPASREDFETYDPAPDRRIVFFDIETQLGANEVGGWGNLKGMRMAVAIAYDSREKKYIRYWEDDAQALIEKLMSADLVIGFNHVRFDYGVLARYTSYNLERATKNFDIMLDVWDRLGHRLSLNALAQATLNHGKTADGLQSLKWWKEGKKEEVATYCEADVAVTKELFEFGLENQNLVYKLKSGEAVRLRLDWELEKIIASAGKPKEPVKKGLKF